VQLVFHWKKSVTNVSPFPSHKQGASFMPRLRHTPPKLCRHESSNRAYVRVDGRFFYLGPWDSKQARDSYNRFSREWLLTGQPPSATRSSDAVEVTEIGCDYLEHALAIYSRDGKRTSEYLVVKAAMERWNQLYGETAISKFGPLAFKAVRQSWMDDGKSPQTIAHYLRHVRRAIAFAVENEKVDVSILTAIKAVEPLRRSRYKGEPVRKLGPVADAVVERTLPLLPRPVRDMVQLQRLTGMRPGEVTIIRPCDISQDGEVWHFEPEHHKTEAHGLRRVIAIGKRAQAILNRYLNNRPAASYCFSPAEAMGEIRAERSAARITPEGQGNRVGSNRKRSPKRTPRDRYDPSTYRRRISEVCTEHGIPKWSPNQLRKSFATEARKVGSLEHAQSALGHTTKSTTERFYAEVDLRLADEIVRKIG
jgi:integrase